MRKGSRRDQPQTRAELWVRAEALAGRSVSELADAIGLALPRSQLRAKGFVGQLVEHALGADPTAGERPDFPHLGVELKTIPLSGNGRPAESTFCCAITMHHADREEWTTSRLRQRLACVLWVPVDGAKVVPSLGARRFGTPRLWLPSSDEEAILRGDWELLMGAVGAGRPPSAHEGVALQLRPKAATARARTLAPSDEGPVSALPLAFYLRARFTHTVLRRSEASA